MATESVTIQVFSEAGEAQELSTLLAQWQQFRLKEAALIAEHKAGHKPFPAQMWLAERSIQEKNLPGAKWRQDKRPMEYIRPPAFSLWRFCQKHLREWYFGRNKFAIGGKI